MVTATICHTYPSTTPPSPDPPQSRAESYLSARDIGSVCTHASRFETLTYVRLPEVNEGPVEPDLRFAVVHRRERRIECVWARSRARQDPRVRPDGLDALVFAHAVHAGHEHVRTQSRENRVHGRPARVRADASTPIHAKGEKPGKVGNRTK